MCLVYGAKEREALKEGVEIYIRLSGIDGRRFSNEAIYGTRNVAKRAENMTEIRVEDAVLFNLLAHIVSLFVQLPL